MAPTIEVADLAKVPIAPAPAGSGGGFIRQWISPGPVVDSFIDSLDVPEETLKDRLLSSAAQIRCLQGPRGSGKTTGGIAALAARAAQQIPDANGVRHYRCLVLRTTYRLLWKNFLPSWWTWFPQRAGYTNWIGGEEQPATHTIRLRTPKGRIVMTIMFAALQEMNDSEVVGNFFRGFETTDIWLEEADQFSELVFNNALLSLGRFPAERAGGAICPTLFCITNAPLQGSWMHIKIIESQFRRGVEYFNQPGGLSPDVENLHNLRPTYYTDAIRFLKDKWVIDRLVHNKFVLPRWGQPVYDTYDDDLHCGGRILLPDPYLDLVLGLDGGMDPALAAAQYHPMGQWRFVNEIASEHGTGSERFAKSINEMLARREFERWNRDRKSIRAVADPSVVYGADEKAGEKNWLQRVAKQTGLEIIAARSNKTSDRKDSMKAFIGSLCEGGERGLLVSTTCPMIRGGLGGLYFFRKQTLANTGGDTAESPTPVKNKYSHPVEAAEYPVMEFGGLENATARLGRSFGPQRALPESTDW